jgi:hypothetical protein
VLIDLQALKARAAARLKHQSPGATRANPANWLTPGPPISQLATLASGASAKAVVPPAGQERSAGLISRDDPPSPQVAAGSRCEPTAAATVANVANRLTPSPRRLSESACRVASMLGALAFLGAIDARNLAIALQWRGAGEVRAALEELIAAGLVVRSGSGFRLRDTRGRP